MATFHAHPQDRLRGTSRPGTCDKQQAIAASGIEMRFHSRSGEVQVLTGVDLIVPTGAFQILMGPSGTGKTTLLSILAGILTPTAGQVCLFGQDIFALSKAGLAAFRQNHVGIVFQEFNLFRSLTALENIELALQLKGTSGIDARNQARFLLDQVGLGDKADRLPRDLSGGQQQRVAIARALAGNPPLILADEPTASLDSKTGQSVIDLMRYLSTQHGSTVLVTTYDQRIIKPGDRIAYLEDGILRK